MLIVITGPMFSGKTSELISMATDYKFAGKNVLAFKPSNDDRYHAAKIVSHTGEELDAIPINKDEPKEILKKLENHELIHDRVDVACIDEAQFFRKSTMETTVRRLLYSQGRTIILSGLSQDSYGETFGAMPYFLATADDIIHLKAVCAKSKVIGAGTRTFRKDSTNTSQVVVGSSDIYEPRSFKEWQQGNQYR